MKPHEKTYMQHPQDSRCVVEPQMVNGAPELVVVADLRLTVDEAHEVGALFSAAPEMARALLHVARSSINERVRNDATGRVDDMQIIVQAALRKAGVLP